MDGNWSDQRVGFFLDGVFFVIASIVKIVWDSRRKWLARMDGEAEYNDGIFFTLRFIVNCYSNFFRGLGVIFFQKPSVRFFDTFFEGYFMFPAEGVKFGDIEEFLRGAVGFCGIVYYFPLKIDNIFYEQRKIFNGKIFSCSDIGNFAFVIGFHKKYACIGKIIDI